MEYWLSLLMNRETDQIVEIAKIAEEVGFDGIFTADHLVWPVGAETPYPYTPDGAKFWPDDTPWPDSWCMLSAMAAVTERIRLGSNVYLAALRDPFTFARGVATTAAIAGDRVVAGVSAGWLTEEYQAAGIDFKTRGKRLDEIIEIARRLWTGEVVEFHGTHFDFGEVLLSPAPPGKVPILVGGGSKPALRRAAQLCDGWLGLVYPKAKLLETMAELKRLRAEVGRQEEPMEIVAGITGQATKEDWAELQDAGLTATSTISPWLFNPKFAKEDNSKLEVKRKAIEDWAERYLPR
jgi:probable F420-dependent oxidoreductase